MSAIDKAFTGSIPENYDRFLVPLIFKSYAVDMAERVASLVPESILEIAAGSGAVTRELASERDPRRIEVVHREAQRVVRARGSLVIAETRHGFICASAGVDASNAPEPGTLVLLPVDPDASAAGLRARLHELTGREVGVVVSDSFGRPWRQGTTDVAIGSAGVEALRDLKGERDPTGYELHSTVIAVADEIAGAAELVMGKLDRAPVAIVRGLDAAGDGMARDLVMPAERNLFP